MLAERFLPTLTRTVFTRVAIAVLAWGSAVVSFAQFDDAPFDLEHAAIEYSTRSTTDAVENLSARLQSGQLTLRADPTTGHLKSILEVLNVPVDSQVVVFSKTSLQSNRIRPDNPRAIYFNDTVAVGFVRGGFIEIAAQDPQQGAVFYRVLPATAGQPAIFRDNRCLQCHYSYSTSGVPGFLARSVPSATDGSALPWLGNYVTDHRSPLSERWAGWFVTGRTGSSRHLGNAPVGNRNADDVTVQEANLNLQSLRGRFDTGAYLSEHSDVVALLVFNHQIRMMNLLTRLGWEARTLAHDHRSEAAVLKGLQVTAREAVDYMLFVDEAKLQGVQGASGFAKSFSARGPRDSKGRSLRDLDLKERLFTYPCSYMIYSEAFDRLPAAAKRAVYARLWDVLSGADHAPKYARLSQVDRDRIIEILRETKTDLPDSFSLRPSRPRAREARTASAAANSSWRKGPPR
jgi:hypothetical protein